VGKVVRLVKSKMHSKFLLETFMRLYQEEEVNEEICQCILQKFFEKCCLRVGIR
jgi:hypothetical protein